jgi:uncharacterized protein YegJ (DUF2314 family)
MPAGALAAPAVVMKRPSIEQYAPPDRESLRYFARGLSDAEQQQLASAREVTSLTFAGPAGQTARIYRVALEMMATLVARTGGLLWDDETREIFGRDACQSRLEGWEGNLPDLSRHFTIHLYREGELMRLVTLGMRKFALPDVSVNQVSSHDSRAMGTLVNLVCQTQLEQGSLREAGKLEVSIGAIRNSVARAKLGADLKRGATGKSALTLSRAAVQEGDADNAWVELVFPGPAMALQERHNATLSAVFGAEDSIVHVEHDAALLDASRRAKAAVLRLKPRFAKGPPGLEQLMVKVPFKTPSGGNEWMWMEVIRWSGSSISGVLQNDPYEVPGLKAGARVVAEEDTVFAFIHRQADGGVEGNETAALLEKASL